MTTNFCQDAVQSGHMAETKMVAQKLLNLRFSCGLFTGGGQPIYLPTKSIAHLVLPHAVYFVGKHLHSFSISNFPFIRSLPSINNDTVLHLSWHLSTTIMVTNPKD